MLRPEDFQSSDSVTDSRNILQANYKYTRITFLTHSFFVDFEHVFVCWGVFRSNSSEEFKEITLFTRSEIFREYIAKNLHSKRVISFVSCKRPNKNVSRYCNKDFKLISIQEIFVTFCQLWKWFCLLRKLWKPPSSKTYQNLRNLQGKYLWQSFVIVKPKSKKWWVTSKKFNLITKSS